MQDVATELAPAFGLMAAVICIADTVPYVRDTLGRSTSPHRGTWLIWAVLAVVAVEAQRADGARWSLVPLVSQAAGTCLVFGLSIWFGSGGLSRIDLALMALAAVGVVGWMVADAPFIATCCVIAADLVAALMMMPKSWREPYSETLSTYVLAAIGGVFAIASVGSGAATLLAYPIYFALVNTALASVIGYRRGVMGQARVAHPLGVVSPVLSSK